MTILGVDLSHFQGSPNMAQVKASGHDFVVLKATQGVSMVDPTCATNRANAHAAGLLVGLYHFAAGGSPTAEAAYFAQKVGALRPGEFLVLDWEITYTGDHVAWCKAWLDAVRNATGVAPLIYMNSSTMNGHNWTPVAPIYGLWLAKYDNVTTQPAVSWWSSAAMKQYWDKGTVPGISGGVDLDVFYGSTAQLSSYGYQGVTDMALTDADAAIVWNHVLAQKNGYGPATAADWLTDTRGGVGQTLAQVSGPQDPTTHTLNSDVRNALAGIAAAVANVQAPVVDAGALAAALVADKAAVATLADALAAAIAARLGNG